MLFYDLINSVDIEKSIKIFLGFCSDSPDIDMTGKNIEHTVHILQSSDYQKNDGMKIVVESNFALNDDAERYDVASVIDTGNGERYALLAMPWNKISGTEICDESLKNYEKEYIVAVVLWEMTWLGYDEESIKKPDFHPSNLLFLE